MHHRHIARVLCLSTMLLTTVGGAQEAPLALTAVLSAAKQNRAEITAAKARAAALGERPVSVAALEDPMIFPSIDHYPSRMMDEGDAFGRYDWSLTFEQRFPLSRVRGQRARVASAEAASADAAVERTSLDVMLEAQQAFFMLRERRLMKAVLERQLMLARELVAGAAARYASGSGLQADVLRAEVEMARIGAAQRALEAQLPAAEAMLNVSMGREASAPVGEIDERVVLPDLPPPTELREAAADSRPELRVGLAEIERATAEVQVMRSMYRPMAMVRAGRASTMAEGRGAMLMLGVSVPLWRKSLRAGVDEAQAMERMARADLLSMQRMIEGEVLAAYGEAQATRAGLDSLESDVLPRARSAVDSALAAYAAGQGGLVLVVDASRALWEAESERVMAESAAGEAWVRLVLAAGNEAALGVEP
jgi:cobalt-zinc-cadmium efflux system outer membrane protein